MEHQDNLFEQFKKAADTSETKEFPGMEKVWSRVDAKLDTEVFKAQKKTNTNWQKYAVAASMVVGTMFAFQLAQKYIFNTVITENPVVEKTNYIKSETQIATIKNDTASVLLEEKEAVKILEKQIHNQSVVVNNNTIKTDSITIKPNAVIAYQAKEESVNIPSIQAESATYDKIRSDQKDNVVETKKAKSTSQAARKANPIVVVDGKAITDKNKAAAEMDDAETITELTNPIYIINGVEYTEKELFGPYPTSPYYPLDKQEITSITVYEQEEAVEKYGKKGENGIVIVKTKNGKPKATK